MSGGRRTRTSCIDRAARQSGVEQGEPHGAMQRRAMEIAVIQSPDGEALAHECVDDPCDRSFESLIQNQSCRGIHINNLIVHIGRFRARRNVTIRGPEQIRPHETFPNVQELFDSAATGTEGQTRHGSVDEPRHPALKFPHLRKNPHPSRLPGQNHQQNQGMCFGITAALKLLPDKIRDTSQSCPKPPFSSSMMKR